jgi:hypothetical protein
VRASNMFNALSSTTSTLVIASVTVARSQPVLEPRLSRGTGPRIDGGRSGKDSSRWAGEGPTKQAVMPFSGKTTRDAERLAEFVLDHRKLTSA